MNDTWTSFWMKQSIMLDHVELGLQAGIFQFSISCSLALKRCLLEVTAEAIAVGTMSCLNGCFTWLSGVVAGYWLPGWK